MPRGQDLAQARETVAVIGGTGALGFGLALRWAIAGLPIVIGSRRPDAAAEAAAEVAKLAGAAGAESVTVEGALNEEAARRSRSVFLCVPFAAQAGILGDIRSGLEAGTALIDATVPLATALGGKPTQPVGLWQGSAAQRAQELVPRGVTVVSALHTVSGHALRDTTRQLEEDVLVCGDDSTVKRSVAALIERIPQLRPVDCGGLEMSRITEQLTPLLITLNVRYKLKHVGVRITGLPSELWS